MQKASSTVLAYADGYSTLEGDSTDMLGGTWQCGALEQDTVGGCEAVEIGRASCRERVLVTV